MKFLITLLLWLPLSLCAQDDSCHIRISLLTVSPGEELYSTFGHSALRVTDSVSNRDIVFNYGTFNFDEPGFYTKFVRGKLMYYLSTDDFPNFEYQNKMENRSITEQVLHLNCREKENVVGLLQSNLIPGNRYYKYDFLFDNCTTRLRDLLENASDSTLHFGNVLIAPTTFRDLIYEYLNYNDKQWSKLGIDILLGSKTDAIMKPSEVMFLPDYLMNTLDSTTINGHPLVSEKASLYPIDYSQIRKKNLTNPLFIFTCLFVLIAFLSFSNRKSIKTILLSFDTLLFFITGVLGLLIVFMWVGTDHVMCQNNYNLLWAWPINVIMAFYVHSKRKGVRTYFLVYSAFNLLLLGFWVFLPQHLNASLIPIIGILIFRTLILIFRKNHF